MKNLFKINHYPKNILVGIFIVLSFFNYLSTLSQYYSSGQDPASVRWMQIKSKNFQLIYPKEFEKSAQLLTSKLEMVYGYASYSLDNKPKKISVILHTQSVTSNATVVWAPKRMDFYTCPPQNSYPQDWLEQLALHEYRHVVQVDKINQGFSKVLYYLFGEQITGGILGLYVPFWFLEGDAVASETALSKTGRGRVPSFEMKLRTQVLEKGKYRYDKASFGSYRDYVPNHYIMGYHMVAMGRKKYGASLWSEAFDQVARYPFMITPFNKGIKKVSGLSKTKLYNEAFDDLDKLWKEQKEKTELSEYSLFSNEQNKYYSDYLNPSYVSDSMAIALKTSIDDIDKMVLLKKGSKEKILFTPGIIFDETLSYASGKFCWSEKQYDLRWQNRNYSVINVYNILTRKLHSITKRSRYFAPALSHKGDKIVAVEVSPDNFYSLVIMDALSGEVYSKYNSQSNDFFMTPSWSEDDERIICVILNDKGKSLAIFNPVSSKMSILLQYSYTEISKPHLSGNYVFYTGSYSGIDNIYALDTATKEIFQVTSSEYGAIDVSIKSDRTKILYSDYTADGFRLVEADINPNKWKPIDEVANNSIKLFESIAKQEKGVVDFANISDTTYAQKRYRKIPHMFNIHSWAPLAIDIDNTSLNPGLSLMSQNKLSSTFINTGYRYNVNEKTGKYYLNLDYEALFPILNIQFETGKRSLNINDHHHDLRFTWYETSLEAGIKIPFNISRGKYFRKIQPKISTTILNVKHDVSTSENFIEGSFHTMDYSLFAYNLIKSSVKDIYSKWGQVIELNYRNTPFGKTDMGNIFSAEVQLYFPGIFNHHSFNIYAGFEDVNYTGNYRFADLISYPKGYSLQSKDSLFSFSFNYDLPLFYPDLSIGSLLYIKRFNANVFYDYAIGWDSKRDKNIYRSFGGELSATFHVLRTIAPVEMGARFIYVPGNNDWKTEFLFGVNFGNL